MTDKERIEQLERSVFDLYKLYNEMLIESNKLLDTIINYLNRNKGEDNE